MPRPDLNLLLTLNVLLDEGNVARAADRLGLSPSAMSRALARLRSTTGDPLLVRAGRGLVPTPRAMELRTRIGPILRDAHAVLQPDTTLVLHDLATRFTLRCSEGFVENFGAALIARVICDAPNVQLRFLPKLGKDSTPLRQGDVDLETGVIGQDMGPEVRAQRLFGDRYIGVVRNGHPLTERRITTSRYTGGQHILVSRRGRDSGPIDRALEHEGKTRQIVTTVGGYGAALALAAGSDLIASVPERHTGTMRMGLTSFPLPFKVPGMTISMFWHPRMDTDPAHRWLRACVREVCGEGA
jgi:DNA-binding transcriptional LysR family regulator